MPVASASETDSPIPMSRTDLVNLLYIVAFVLFVEGLRRLRGPRTAVQGNQIAAVGMALAVGATLLIPGVGDWGLIVAGVAIGTAIGIPSARAVKMTAMPQMVALFNGVGGGAVALISLVEFLDADGELELETVVPILFAAIVGSISFWGSNIAFLKLQETLKRGFKVPRAVNGALAAIAVILALVIAAGADSELLFVLILLAAGTLGILAVLPIGGADMPVVISTLNAFTGLSAAAAGIALDNTALIVAGMLVGASGSILTKQMADAMNRSIGNVFFGGLGAGGPAAAASESGGTVRSTSAADVAIQLSYARLVVVVPGYGMAVAQAQRAVADLAAELEKRGVEVLYAIHPVAGRMPGHMNVLLAEADVPYDKLKEMDDINGEFARTDVALVIGANDVTNPAARTVADSPIYGMPILDVDKSSSVIVLKRSMSSGFAGIDNPLFYDERTSMLFGDAKSSVSEVLGEVQQL
jgi:NAD(P) transhydrogenase subunit beta